MTRISKQKGRTGQNEIKQLYKDCLEIPDDHISSAIMGESGEDIKFSPEWKPKINQSIEVKRRKSGLKTVYDFLDQAREKEGNPVVFFRADRKEWITVIPTEYFMELLKTYVNSQCNRRPNRSSRTTRK